MCIRDRYEAKKAFEQYDAVDARNRLVAGELERRWNEKLEEVETTKQRLSSLDGKQCSLSSDEEAKIRLMGENFAESWQSDHCPPTLKKMIFRTAIEEIIVRADAENKTLQFTIHWSGGAHTQLKMERPRSATDTATPVEALERVKKASAVVIGAPADVFSGVQGGGPSDRSSRREWWIRWCW